MLGKTFISWCPDIEYDERALRALTEDQFLDGIEITHVNGNIKKLREAGIPISIHNILPRIKKTLMGEEIVKSLDEGDYLKALQESEAPIVGFHMQSPFPEENICEVLSECHVIDRITNNLILIEEAINREHGNKKILIETMAFYNNKGFDKILKQVRTPEQRKFLYGTATIRQNSPYYRLLTDPSTAEKVIYEFERKRPGRPENVGFLCDVAHIHTTVASWIQTGQYSGTVEEYFSRLCNRMGEKIYQFHINVPEGSDEIAFIDGHQPIKPGEEISDRILRISKMLTRKCQNVEATTLEITTGKKPYEHVKTMSEQARILYNYIDQSGEVQKPSTTRWLKAI